MGKIKMYKDVWAENKSLMWHWNIEIKSISFVQHAQIWPTVISLKETQLLYISWTSGSDAFRISDFFYLFI